MQQQIPTKSLLALAVLVVATMVLRLVLVGSKPLIVLSSSSQAIGGVVAQSLGPVASSPTGLQTEGSDFRLSNTRYFYQNNWAVTTVESFSGQTKASKAVVLRNYNGAYKIVLGPESSLSVNDTQGLPDDVINYIRSLGVIIYEPSN